MNLSLLLALVDGEGGTGSHPMHWCPHTHLVASGLAPLHATWAQLARLGTMLLRGAEKQVSLRRSIIAGITSPNH
jgi:hypothetical protein